MRRMGDGDAVDECGDEVVGVLKGVASDGFPFCLFSNKFVISHNFFEYAASMPNSAPAKVATSPNPMSSDSWISPCGSMYTPQKRSARPPTARTAAVIICRLNLVMFLKFFANIY